MLRSRILGIELEFKALRISAFFLAQLLNGKIQKPSSSVLFWLFILFSNEKHENQFYPLCSKIFKTKKNIKLGLKFYISLFL